MCSCRDSNKLGLEQQNPWKVWKCSKTTCLVEPIWYMKSQFISRYHPFADTSVSAYVFTYKCSDVKAIFKAGKMLGLVIYWGCNSQLFSLSITMPVSFTIHWLIIYSYIKCEKCLSQFARAYCDVIRLLQQPKTQRLLIHYHKWHRKAANSHF